jgi:hypothetical protein
LSVCKKLLSKFYKDALHVRQWISDISWIIKKLMVPIVFITMGKSLL